MDNSVQEIRTLNTIEMEIRVLQDQAQRMILGYAIETGRRLEEAKAMVGHGQWGNWLKKMGYGQSTAQNLIRVFREYGASQQNLFGGEPNSQTFGNLTYSKALKLLALPDREERDAFVAEHDVENMSTCELEKALKERAEALEAAKIAEESRAKMEADMVMLQEQCRSSQEAVAAAQKELDDLKSKPVVDVAVMAVDQEKLDQARAAAIAEMQDKVEKAQAKAEKAEEKRKEAEIALAGANAKLEEAAKAEKNVIITGDGDLSAFRLLFDQVKESVNKMSGLMTKVQRREDSNTAEIMQRAMSALAEQMVKVAEM